MKVQELFEEQEAGTTLQVMANELRLKKPVIYDEHGKKHGWIKFPLRQSMTFDELPFFSSLAYRVLKKHVRQLNPQPQAFYWREGKWGQLHAMMTVDEAVEKFGGDTKLKPNSMLTFRVDKL